VGIDRARLGEHEAVVVEHRHLSEGVEPPVLLAPRFPRGMIHAVHPVGHAQFLERPQDAQIARETHYLRVDAAEAVEREHSSIVDAAAKVSNDS
jgi:hypothetical protein